MSVSTVNTSATSQTELTMKYSKESEACCERRTTLEIVLLLVVGVLLTAGTAAIVILALREQPSASIGECVMPKSAETPPCMTRKCVSTAAYLLDKMDMSVDPCQDFYQYACGGWIKDTHIPDESSYVSGSSLIREKVRYQLKGLLESAATEDEPVCVQDMKNLYQLCTDVESLEEKGIDPILRVVEDFGGWPVLGGWNASGFDMFYLITKTQMLGSYTFFFTDVEIDAINSSAMSIQIKEVPLGMRSRTYFLNDRNSHLLEAYRQMATKIALYLGALKDTAEKDMDDMVQFEIQLANITLPLEQKRDDSGLYRQLTVSDMYTVISNDFDWLRYFNMFFQPVDISVTEDEVIGIKATQYLTDLFQLLENTPSRTIANYVLWRFILFYVEYLPERFRTTYNDYVQVAFGTRTEQARWKFCMSYADGMPLGRLYVDNYFNEKAKSIALEMTEDILAAFNELLDENSWMDTETRDVAKEKADAVIAHIGYPDFILNDTALDLDVQSVRVIPGELLVSMINRTAAINQRFLRELRKPVAKKKWPAMGPPARVNAFYQSSTNVIVFPAAFLHPPYYDEDSPKSVNFGGIGMVIGHELTHGFDDRGRQYDKDGNLRQWWSDEAVKRFREKADCIVYQYGNYSVPEVGMMINGINTQGENIADNGGLKEAYRAYRRWVERRGKEEDPLPGMDLNHNQLFFLSFAQLFCSKDRPEWLSRRVQAAYHSPNRYRVVGSLSNVKEFAELYGCPLGSPMNPTKKCAVW